MTVCVMLFAPDLSELLCLDKDYPALGADYTLGDIQQVADTLGHATYQKYNKHGKSLLMTGPNGVVTVNTDDPRQRPTSSSVGGQAATYTNYPVGRLTRVTQPDLSYVGYTYDPAHSLTAVADSKGNKIEYTLDNAGSRTAENVADPGGLLARTRAGSYDVLNRVRQTTGRE